MNATLTRWAANIWSWFSRQKVWVKILLWLILYWALVPIIVWKRPATPSALKWLSSAVGGLVLLIALASSAEPAPTQIAAEASSVASPESPSAAPTSAAAIPSDPCQSAWEELALAVEADPYHDTVEGLAPTLLACDSYDRWEEAGLSVDGAGFYVGTTLAKNFCRSHAAYSGTPVCESVKPSPKPVVTSSSAPSDGSECDPSYPDVCIPPISVSGDLDCGDVPYTNFKVLPPDPHGFDGNNDGVACTS